MLPAAGSTAIGSMNDFPKRCAFFKPCSGGGTAEHLIHFSFPVIVMKILPQFNLYVKIIITNQEDDHTFKMTGIDPPLFRHTSHRETH